MWNRRCKNDVIIDWSWTSWVFSWLVSMPIITWKHLLSNNLQFAEFIHFFPNYRERSSGIYYCLLRSKQRKSTGKISELYVEGFKWIKLSLPLFKIYIPKALNEVKPIYAWLYWACELQVAQFFNFKVTTAFPVYIER